VAAPKTRYWAVVPAAGIGARMGATCPKQYLPLLGRPVIAHTIARLCAWPRLAGVIVGLACDDVYWAEAGIECSHLRTYIGGAERAATVLLGLKELEAQASLNDWVLVHDAVRPCITHADLERLCTAVGDDPEGGLLGAPVPDTLKRVADGRVTVTVPRADLWRAFTPQMFRFGQLVQALTQAQAEGREITDEAAAVEAIGARPRMVQGSPDNIKITVPEDLALADMILRRQGEHEHH